MARTGGGRRSGLPAGGAARRSARASTFCSRTSSTSCSRPGARRARRSRSRTASSSSRRPPGTYVWAANSAGLYDDIDMCVTVTTVAGGRPGRRQGRARSSGTTTSTTSTSSRSRRTARRRSGGASAASGWRRSTGRTRRAPTRATAAQRAARDDGRQRRDLLRQRHEFKKLAGSPPDNGQQIGLLAASPAAGRGALRLRQSEGDQALTRARPPSSATRASASPRSAP